MEVELIKENPDGSGVATVVMSDEEKEYLIKWAIIELMKKAIEEGKNYAVREDDLDNT